ncbi:hypothetical protein OPQ81_011205 [Rhizoctonia solani]|nr:hypothetical protein OPQ81_011205 [Rhizoctonia solani]
MSALLGDSGNFTGAKSRIRELDLNEDSPNDEVKSTLPGDQKHEPGLETGNSPTKQQRGDADSRLLAHNILEYSPAGAAQSEEYGLGKEAKFWQTYVKETDSWDAELVGGWNKSLDVLLVFAALFSAIVTGLIVESSKLLKEDPADVSAQTLLVISQTLMAMANNTQPVGLPSTSSGPPLRSFSPRRCYQCSLEWCHSFMTGRIGHPCLQARRRQQKWTMIERWKMRELILVLPSLMHLSLLLFAIGLCIYVWGLNPTVAIPVFCVCGIVVGFYIWSSLTASILDHFPYTTMASRVLRSGLVKPVYHFLRFGTAMFLLFAYVVALVTILCLIMSTICIPSSGYVIAGWVNPTLAWFEKVVYWLVGDESQDQSEEPSQDIITSRAISWMVTNCEVPRSVDIALQAIASANKQLPREPLEACNAASVISRRLGSGDLYSKAETRLVSRYIRALFVLGSNAEPTADSHKDELEIMIRDVQSGSKNQVVNLITDGNFIPNSQNLEALRIGSNAPQQCLTLIRNPAKAGPLPLSQVVRLLQDHLNDSKPLHPAALLSLVNAVAMLASCAPGKGASNPAQIITRLLHSILSSPPSTKSTLFEMSGILAACALSQSRSIARPEAVQLDRLARTEQSLRALADYMQGKKSSEAVFWSGVLELSSHPDTYGLDAASESEWLIPASELSHQDATEISMIEDLHHHATMAFSDISDKLFSTAAVDTDLIEEYVENIHRAYSSAQIRAPPTQVYVFLLECLSHANMKDFLVVKCTKVLAQLSFPRLSLELVRWLRERDIIPKLREAAGRWPTDIRFSAACHLWVLFTLYLDSPRTAARPT